MDENRPLIVCRICREPFERAKGSATVYCSGCVVKEPQRPLMLCEKECPVCGRTFMRMTNHQKYCSGECRTEMGRRNRASPPPVNCIRCGRSFTRASGSQKFCSAECRSADYQELGPRTCDDCGRHVNEVAMIGSTRFCLKCLARHHEQMLSEQRLYRHPSSM